MYSALCLLYGYTVRKIMVNCFKDIVKYVDTDSYDVQIIIITIILWDASEKKRLN